MNLPVLLPNVSLIGHSEESLKEGFLRVGQILFRYLEQIESAVATNEDFLCDPFNMVALGLLSKLRCHYYTFVLLEIYSDEIGSQFLTEQLYETAVTLTYLIEKGNESTFKEYIDASVSQARLLLSEIESQLQEFPDRSHLLSLKTKLQSSIAQQQKQLAAFAPFPHLGIFSEQGKKQENATEERAVAVGLVSPIDPARKAILRIKPASWLDLQINYFGFESGTTYTKSGLNTNFKRLRDTTHICLHATRAFLEEVVAEYPSVKLPNRDGLCQELGIIFEWFHNAYKAYKLLSSVRKLETDGMKN